MARQEHDADVTYEIRRKGEDEIGYYRLLLLTFKKCYRTTRRRCAGPSWACPAATASLATEGSRTGSAANVSGKHRYTNTLVLYQYIYDGKLALDGFYAKPT